MCDERDGLSPSFQEKEVVYGGQEGWLCPVRGGSVLGYVGAGLLTMAFRMPHLNPEHRRPGVFEGMSLVFLKGGSL